MYINMEKHTNERLSGAIRSIYSTDEGKYFLNWLKNIQNNGDGLISYVKNDIELRWLQGKLQLIDFIDQVVRDAVNPVDNKSKECVDKSLRY